LGIPRQPVVTKFHKIPGKGIYRVGTGIKKGIDKKRSFKAKSFQNYGGSKQKRRKKSRKSRRNTLKKRPRKTSRKTLKKRSKRSKRSTKRR